MLPRIFLAASAAAGIFAAGPALASYVVSAVGNGPQTNTPGQEVDLVTPTVTERAKTEFGANHVFAAAANNDSGVATSEFVVDFTLSAPAVLAVHYSYDFSISNGSLGYQINGSGPNFHAFFLNVIDNLASGSNNDFCADRAPGAHPDGFCAGPHAGMGIVDLAMPAGANSIDALLAATAGSGGSGGGLPATVDAFNTAAITEIDVPAGVTFTYTDLSGNPLNVRTAQASPVPEPATATLLGTGLLGALALRRRRRPRPASSARR